MNQIISSLMTIALLIFAMLLLIGGVTGNPWTFATAPFRGMMRWVSREIRTFLQGTWRYLWRQVGRGLRFLLGLFGQGINRLIVVLWRGWVYLWRNHQTLSNVVLIIILATIIFSLMVIAGFV